LGLWGFIPTCGGQISLRADTSHQNRRAQKGCSTFAEFPRMMRQIAFIPFE
jgi:hypothetical protein